MTLFGSLKTSVTGLSAQSTKMGAISDNIANVSTVGYKRTDVQFATLVTERIGDTKFTPGGVTARPRQTLDVQGIIQGSAKSTDLAVSGAGMFIVTEEDTFGVTRDNALYTRSGSFRPDDDGYLRNAAGFYLQGYTTNRDGTPARDGVDFEALEQNFDDLEPVDINRISNIAEETDNIKIRANLPAEATNQITITDIDNDGALTTADVNRGIASATAADFSSSVQIFDAEGTPRTLTLNWYKLGDSSDTAGNTNTDGTPNEWALHIDARTGLSDMQNSTENYTVNAAAGVNLTGVAVDTLDNFSGTITSFVDAINGIALGGTTTDGIGATEKMVATNLGYNDGTGTYQVQVDRVESTTGAVTATETIEFDPTAAAGTATAGNADVTYTPPADVEVGLVSFVGDFDESVEGSDLVTAGGFATQTLFVKFNGDGSLRNIWTDVQAMRADVLDTDGDGIDGSAIGNRETDASETPRQIGIAAYTATNAGQVPESGAAVDIGTALTTNNFTTDFLLKEDGDATDTVAAQQANSPFAEQGAQPLFAELFLGRGTTVGDSLVGNTSTDDTFDGTGLDGFTQFDSGEADPILETLFIQQDGIRSGTVNDVEVSADGLVTAIYDNGLTRPIYQLALAKFANYNGLINKSGNVYQESEESGDVLLAKPGLSGLGDVVGGAVENANVDLGEEFTDMIVTQQAFTANTRSITTTDEMLTDINNLIR